MCVCVCVCVCARAHALACKRAIMCVRVFYHALYENEFVNFCMFCLLVYIPLSCMWVFAGCMFFFKL